MAIFTDIDGVFGHGISSGIKPEGKDLAFIWIPGCVASAAVFTQNLFCASCVSVTRKHQKRHVLKAIVINSGNANAVTGAEGDANTARMVKGLASRLGISHQEVGVASTGIIGQQLPIDRIESGIMSFDLSARDGVSVAEAILTTDTCIKTTTKTKKIGKKQITVSGVAKGSGMIAPNMATMLGFLVTNVSVSTALLQDVLSDVVADTFNMISVDTDTSTNDMVTIQATGEYQIAQNDAAQLAEFKQLVFDACLDLALQIVKDGEGASKLIEVRIRNAASEHDARQVALQVANSPLVKAAVAGEDANWGRVIMAAGKSETVKLNPKKVDVHFGDVQVLSSGLPISYNDEAIHRVLKSDHVVITLDLNLGRSSAVAWGCDLTEEYVVINKDYN